MSFDRPARSPAAVMLRRLLPRLHRGLLNGLLPEEADERALQLDRLVLSCASVVAFTYMAVALHDMPRLQLAVLAVFLYTTAILLGFSFAEQEAYFKHRAKIVLFLRLLSALMSLCVPRIVGHHADAIKAGERATSQLLLHVQLLLMMLLDITWVLVLAVGADGRWQQPLGIAVQAVCLAVVMSQNAQICIGIYARSPRALHVLTVLSWPIAGILKVWMPQSLLASKVNSGANWIQVRAAGLQWLRCPALSASL